MPFASLARPGFTGLVAFLIATPALSGVAVAEPSRRASTPVTSDGARDADTALAQYRSAYDAMERGEWLRARELLLKLWARTPTYDVAASLGQVEYQLLNFPAAAQYMAFAIENVAPKEKFENLERYRAALREIRSWVGTLELTVQEPYAEVLVDGKVVGRGPFRAEVFVSPGTHELTARVGSRAEVSKAISIAAGETRAETLQLASAPLTVPANGAAASVTPKTTPIAISTGYADAESGSRTERSHIPIYVGGALTLAGAGMAVGFGLAANSAENDAERLRARLGPNGCASGSASADDCRAAEDAVDRQKRSATLSTVGLGVGAAAAVTTLGYWLFWPSSSKGSAGSLRPEAALSASGASFSMAGAF